MRKDFDFYGRYVKTTVEIRGLALRDSESASKTVSPQWSDAHLSLSAVLATTFEGAEGLRLNEEPPCVRAI